MDCPELIQEFLDSQKATKERTDAFKRKSVSENESEENKPKKKKDPVRDFFGLMFSERSQLMQLVYIESK